MTMTDEDLSELAECIQDACESTCRPIAPFDLRYRVPGLLPCCLLGALLDDDEKWGRYPNPGQAGDALGIPREVSYGLSRGFDGSDQSSFDDPRAFALGRFFREQYG